MFVTLRTSNKDPKGSTMEQITATNASHGGAETRSGIGRRAACAPCQSRKLRCTGTKLVCDRCKIRNISCEPSHQTRRSRRKETHTTKEVVQDNPIPARLNTPESINSATSSPNQGLQPVETPELYWPDTADSSFLNQGPSLPDSVGQGSSVQARSDADATKCSCIDELLDTVQRLDDDEFHLRSLTFDQVLKLQKYLLFQCLQPMGCSRCVELARAHTLVLVICDRVTEMFQCLSRRLGHIQPKPADAGVPCVGEPSTDGSSHSVFSFREAPTAPLNWGASQIFDGETGAAGISTICNPEMFSDSFRDQYSVEEQFHMIQVLTRLQIKNFKKLLVRVGDMPQSQKSQARMGKIRALHRRLEEGAEIMEQAFESILQDMEMM